MWRQLKALLTHFLPGQFAIVELIATAHGSGNQFLCQSVRRQRSELRVASARARNLQLLV